jgi:hypothetical protein
LFGTLLVILWIVGELAGAIIGAMVSAANSGQPQMIVVYAGALIGAAAGAAFAYGLVGLSRDKWAASRTQLQTLEVAPGSAVRVS